MKYESSDSESPLAKMATRTGLMLQGGGALGAFECGVVKAMEEKGIFPDIVAGVSIGAFNAAIIAGNSKNPTSALEAFWNEIELNTPDFPNEKTRRLLSSWYTLLFGSPRFFRPRWFTPIFYPNQLPVSWKSFCDPSPVKDLLHKYVDFDQLKHSPIRLLVNAVNVETAELETFDSYINAITTAHILASGSLPPGFPWTTINGKHYWDGGIVSNTPLNQVIELCGPAFKKIYVVDLYPRRNALPKNMMEVLTRKDEIFYSEKIREDIHSCELMNNYKKLIDEIMSCLEPKVAEEIKEKLLYIQTMKNPGPLSITRIVHEGEEEESQSRDYDFSRKSIGEHIEQGYTIAKKILNEEDR